MTGSPWAGTGHLLRLHLRLDRIRIPVWALAIGITVAASMVTFRETYTTPESLQARAGLLGNPAAVMMTGPAFALDNYTFGAMVANELSLWLFIASGIMSVLLVVRHTRAEEESGRLEVVRALPVGRYAPPTAAIVTVAVANLAVGLAVVAGLFGTGIAMDSAWALGAGTALTGMVFAAVAAVAAQFLESARSAAGAAWVVMALAFLVRGVGDVIDNQGSWLSWFSPFAWAQQMRLWVDLRWWPLALSVGAVLVLVGVAVVLARRRDLGAGLRAPSPGPATAAPSLLSTPGLARRLLTGSFLAWTAATFLFAVAFGSLANSLGDFLDDIPELGNWMQLDLVDVTESFAAAMLSFLVVAPAVLAVASILRLRSEEAFARTEAMLVTGASRPRHLAGWLAVIAVGTAVMTGITGLGVGLGMWLGTGDLSWVGRLTVASLAYLPAILLLGAVALAIYGLVPAASAWAWAPVVWATLVLYLGELLNLPDWMRNLSPIQWVPLAPMEAVEALPLVVMGALALGFTAVGFAAFRRRDVTPG